MKLTREHIIVLVVFVLVLATLGSAYQFYYVPRVQEYKDHLTRRQELEDALKRVENKFSNTQPTIIIQAVKDQIGPLQEELIRRASFFNITGMDEIEPIPDNKILRFYYIDEYNRIVNKLRQDAYTKGVYIPDVLNFDAPKPEELAGRTMTINEVRDGLKHVTFGCAMITMLMDSKAPYINQVVVWPRRLDLSYNKLLWTVTTGFNFYMSYSDLVAFIEKLRTSERYFSINALSLQNRYLRWPTEPPLEVSLLITQAIFNPPAPEAAPGGAPGAPAMGGGMTPTEKLMNANMLRPTGMGRGNSRMGSQQELTKFQRTKRWLKKYFWPF